MASTRKPNTPSLLLLLSFIATTATASPLPFNLAKRTLTTGAEAGLGIGIAVLIIISALIIAFFVIHLRRKSHNRKLNLERAILAGEKNPDGTVKHDKFSAEPEISTIPRRNKSVKDRLMGPLYRESMALPQMPKPARSATGDRDSFLSKPWAASGENSPRPSFSSKRATRMMMMM